MPKDNRYTIAFSPAAEQAVKAAMEFTHYKSVPDVVRAAISVFVDLLDVESRDLTILFRDGANGREWSYSPHHPGRATPVKKEENSRKNNVIAGTFPPRPVEAPVALGMNAPSPESDAKVQDEENQRPPRQRRKT